MCVIVAFANGQELPDDKLKNAVLNNPHGFGIITVHDGKLEVYHKFDERGNNPEVVARELEKRKGADWNYLHVRYCTRGDKSKDNTHPFTVYKSKDRRVEFMHNGSLSNRHSNTSGSYVAGQPIKSDSRLYAERFLSPMLYHWTGENGVADIEDVFLESILDEHFSYTNRGLLVANDLEAMYLGKWDTTLGKKGNDDKIVVSNTDYFFNSLTSRMTEFYKPKMSDIPRFLQGPTGNSNKPSTSNSATDEEEVGDQAHYPLGTAGIPSAKMGPAPIETTAEASNPTDTQSTTSPTTKATGSTGKLHAGSTTMKAEHKGRKITKIAEVDLKKTGRFLQPSDIDGLFDTTAGELDDELIGYIAMLSLTEFRSYVDLNPDGAARLLEHIFLRAQALIEDNEELGGKVLESNDRHLRASSRIANLVSILKQHGVEVNANPE